MNTIAQLKEFFFGIVTLICVPLLVLSLAIIFIRSLIPPFIDAFKRFVRTEGVATKVVCLAFCLVAIYVGGTKGGGKISFDGDSEKHEGLFDDGSYLTNTYLHAKWTYEGIPSEAKVYIDRRDYGSTNEWTNIGTTVAGALKYDYSNETTATNYEFYIWWYYMPPAPVHTNGVWVGKAYKTHYGTGYITVNTAVVDHGKIIATPEKKDTDK